MSNFIGFEQANTTPVPDVLFDELLDQLTGAELKVLLYIIRRTAGFKKATDAISLTQMQDGIITKEGKQLDHGCGIKRRNTITDALTSLETKGFITSAKKKTTAGDADTTVYGIRFKKVVTKPDYPRSHQTGLPVVTKPDYGSPKTGLGVVTKPYPQETVLQQTDSQDTELQERESDAFASACASPADVSLSELALEGDTPTEKVALVAQPPMQQQIAPSKRESAKQKPSSRLAQGGVQSTDVPARQAARAPGPPYSAEAGAIMDLWDSTFARSQPRTAANIEAAQQLVASNPTAEELKTCRLWLFTTDDPKRPWFRKKGVALADVAKNFSNWQSLADAAPREKPKEDDEYSWDAIMRRQREREAEEALA